jgi:4-alpha-glucanotransferase
MADPWGVDDGYWDVGGTWHDTPSEIRRALRLAMGGLPDTDDPPPHERPVWFVRHGDGPAIDRPARLVLEDGTELPADRSLPPDVPLGYHDLHPSDGGITTRLIVVPERASPPPDRVAALAVQLYATRSRTSWGIGDFGDLAAVARWTAGAGLGALLVSPLHAPLPVDDPEPSPYFASSRCWRNPLHLRIEDIDGYDGVDPDLVDLAEQGRSLNTHRRIDRTRVWRLKRAALRRIWQRRAGTTPAGFAEWRAAQGAHLERYATFCALAEHHGGGWSGWPEEHRHPGDREVAAFAAWRADRVSFWAWLQYLLDRQLRRAGEALPLLTDLAIGVDPDGADAWMLQDVLALGARVGAPPDAFNRAGQDWGLPPFVPWKLREAAYEPLARLWRAALGGGGGVRIDHVMGLFRLYWLPPGVGAADGAYVRYRGDELLAVLAVESVRAGAVVVGEDLGTVEPAVRTALADAHVLSYKLVWFEDEPPERYPAQALAGVTTHDLPTIAGAWTGADDEDQRAAGVEPDPSAMDDLRRRLRDVSGRPADAPLDDVIVDVHARLAAGPCSLVAATLEDGLAVPERPNLPGTTSERPNWSFALPVSLEEALEDPLLGRVADALRR